MAGAADLALMLFGGGDIEPNSQFVAISLRGANLPIAGPLAGVCAPSSAPLLANVCTNKLEIKIESNAHKF